MSIPMVIESEATPPLHTRLAAHGTVGVARLLAHLSPEHLTTALHLLRHGARPADAAEATAARAAVVATSTRCQDRKACLQRSLATTLLCRLHGSWPQWCTGVMTQPFRAHAWVSVDDTPIGEEGDIQFYTPMLTVGPLATR